MDGVQTRAMLGLASPLISVPVSQCYTLSMMLCFVLYPLFQVTEYVTTTGLVFAALAGLAVPVACSPAATWMIAMATVNVLAVTTASAFLVTKDWRATKQPLAKLFWTAVATVCVNTRWLACVSAATTEILVKSSNALEDALVGAYALLLIFVLAT